MKTKKSQYIIIMIIALIFCIGCFLLFVTKPRNTEATTEPETTETEIEPETITIENIESYKGVVIVNNKIFYNFEEITIDSENLSESLGKIQSSFKANDDNTYNLVNNTAYNVKAGKEIFSIKEDSNIAITNDYNLGYSYYVEDISKAKEKYKLENRNVEDVVRFYSDAESLEFKEYTDYTLKDILGNQITGKTLSDYEDCDSFLLAIKENGINYNYSVFKDGESYVLADIQNNEFFEININ